MKQFAIFLGQLCCCLFAFGQPTLYDKDFKPPPDLNLDNMDSVKLIKIYEFEIGGMSQEPIEKSGFLDLEVTFDGEQRILTFDKYNENASGLEASYEFSYSENGEVDIRQVYSSNSKSHRWHLRDSLIQEIKLLKGKKKKLKAHWQYTYRDDTLLTSLVKYDKNKYVQYQMDYAYSELNQVTRQTIKERGKPPRWLEATYDDEGNIIGYRNEDGRKSLSGSQVSIERDSSDLVTSVSYQSRRGTNDLWQYEYNEAEKPVKSILRNGNGKVKRKIDYSYDGDGNEVQKIITEANKVKQRRDQKYDERGNLISVHYYRRFLGDLDLIYYLLFTYDEADRMIRKDYWSKDYNLRRRWDYAYEVF